MHIHTSLVDCTYRLFETTKQDYVYSYSFLFPNNPWVWVNINWNLVGHRCSNYPLNFLTFGCLEHPPKSWNVCPACLYYTIHKPSTRHCMVVIPTLYITMIYIYIARLSSMILVLILTPANNPPTNTVWSLSHYYIPTIHTST